MSGKGKDPDPKDEKIKDAIKKEGDAKDKEIKPGGIDKIQEGIDKNKKP